MRFKTQQKSNLTSLLGEDFTKGFSERFTESFNISVNFKNKLLN